MSYKSDNWWVSPFNFVPEVTKDLANMPRKVRFHDATLRDGEQTPGVVFRMEEKVEIATMLSEAGVDRIEVAFPSVSDEDVQAVKAVVAKKLKADIFVFCRGVEKDIDLAMECGVDGIILELPIGEPRMQHQFSKWSRQDLIDKTLKCVDYAKQNKGLEVVLFPMDCSRADPAFLDQFLRSVAANEKKPDSIALVDTTGCLIPQAAMYLVRRMKEITGTAIEVHTHSDMGLGVSTSIAAVAAGADVVHTSVAGLGERTGNTALEQVAVALKTLMGLEMNLDIGQLTHLARRVTEIARVNLPVNMPIVGERAFTRESGLGLDMIFNAPLALFSLLPEAVGQKANYVLGKKSGLASVDLKCKDLGLQALTDEQKKALLNGIKNLSMDKKGLVTDEEFMKLFAAMTK